MQATSEEMQAASALSDKSLALQARFHGGPAPPVILPDTGSHRGLQEAPTVSAGPSRRPQGPGTRRQRNWPSTCHELRRQRSARPPGFDEVPRHPRLGPITDVNLNFCIGSA